MLRARRAIMASGVAPADVDDVLHAGVEKALRALPGLRDHTRFEAWVARIATRCAIDHLRAAGRAQARLSDHDVEALAHEDSLTERSDASGLTSYSPCVAPFLARLAAPDAEVLRLKDVEGRPSVQVAALLGISLPAAKSRILRARRRLARALVACCGELAERPIAPRAVEDCGPRCCLND